MGLWDLRVLSGVVAAVVMVVVVAVVVGAGVVVVVVVVVDFGVVVIGVVVTEASVVGRVVGFALIRCGLTDTTMDSGVDDTMIGRYFGPAFLSSSVRRRWSRTTCSVLFFTAYDDTSQSFQRELSGTQFLALMPHTCPYGHTGIDSGCPKWQM